MELRSHLFTSVNSFEDRLYTLLKRTDKLLKCVDLARQTSQQHVDYAQHHIVSLGTQIKGKLTQQEERLSDLRRAATRVDNVASSIKDEQHRAEIYLQSLLLLVQNMLKEHNVDDQQRFLPSLEKDVDKRWRTEIPGVVWLNKPDQKINMSDVNHLTLTETSHKTSLLPRLGRSTGSGRALRLEKIIYDHNIPRLKPGPVTVTGASIYTAEIIRCKLKPNAVVTGICVYNGYIFVTDGQLHMFNGGGDYIKKVSVAGMRATFVTVMTQDEGDKLIISSSDQKCLCYIPLHRSGDVCILGSAHRKQLNYIPTGLCVNHNDNLVAAEMYGDSLHVHNSSGDEINMIKLPYGIMPRYLTSDLSGSYIITNMFNDDSGPRFEEINWIDYDGAEQLHVKILSRHKLKCHLHGVVVDSQNRCLVADLNGDKLYLFIRDRHDVKCQYIGGIIKPWSLYLDEQQGKLYVGAAWIGQVVVYDYYMLLGDARDIQYNMTRLGIKST